MTTQEIRARIGTNILYLQGQYGLSRRSLAKLIKIPESRLRRIEAGDPSAKLYDFHLKRLARIFDISVDLLFAPDLVP